MAEQRVPSSGPEAALFVPESAARSPANEAHDGIDRLLEQVESPRSAPLLSPPSAVGPARLALLRGLRWLNPQEMEVALRSGEAMRASVSAELDREFLSQAIRDGQLLLCEWPERGAPMVVGVVQTRPPSKLSMAADEIELNATRELVLRSGSAALRLRSSGEIELVGSRISAVSRGLMRLIGRLVRLN